MVSSDDLRPSNVRSAGRILLVEDEPTNMAILSAYICSAGFTVVEAVDGKIAWDILSKDAAFDLVVTDRQMPNMDGMELAIRIRNDARTRSIPVIMETSANSQAEIQEGIRAGVYYYLTKPYEEATLLGIVRSAVQEHHQNALFQQRMAREHNGLSTLAQGEFHIRAPEEAQNLALLLGSAYDRPELAASGLYEIFLNAIEHGNLGIGYETKNKLLSEGSWKAEIGRRLSLAENSGKKVTVYFKRADQQIEITVTDEGKGFDWRPFIELEPSRATHGSGRGIAKAALLSFDRVDFEGAGNKVKILSK